MAAVKPDASDIKAPLPVSDDRYSDDDEFNQQGTHKVTAQSNNDSCIDGQGPSEKKPTATSSNNNQPITMQAIAVSKSSTTDFSSGEDVYQTTMREDSSVTFRFPDGSMKIMFLESTDTVEDIIGNLQKEDTGVAISVRHRDGEEYAKANKIGVIFKGHSGFLVDIGNSRNLVTSVCSDIPDIHTSQASTSNSQAKDPGDHSSGHLRVPGEKDDKRFSKSGDPGFLMYMELPEAKYLHKDYQRPGLCFSSETPENLKELYKKMKSGDEVTQGESDGARFGCVKKHTVLITSRCCIACCIL